MIKTPGAMMKSKAVLYVLCVFLFCFSVLPVLAEEEGHKDTSAGPSSGSSAETLQSLDISLSSKEIIEKVDQRLRGKTSYQEMEMTIYNPDWRGPRTYKMKAWEDVEAEKSFILITHPPRERGKAFLKEGYVFKAYIPSRRENKPMTIPPSLMLQPWMGSNFTRDDLVKESSIVHDYTHHFVSMDESDVGTLVHIRMEPKPDAPVVWGRIDYWVKKDGFIPYKVRYYDDRGKAVREMTMTEVEEMDGREVPTRWEMESLEAEDMGKRTVLKIKEVDFNLKIDSSVFTEKNLTRRNRDW